MKKTIVKIGIDNLPTYKLTNKENALLTNASGVTMCYETNIDFLIQQDVRVVKLFGPEHGIWGAAADGVKVENEVEPRYKIPIYSLYGNNLR
ncbi:MAG: DUF1343 domain-containing protein, partial [Thermotogae bacterium]|nr:DUF1343 domain-containing protein [Thermotogota bacterium]MCL5032699.1 DUF1343 domain-containing protein [Thermotogota bacterium]